MTTMSRVARLPKFEVPGPEPTQRSVSGLRFRFTRRPISCVRLYGLRLRFTGSHVGTTVYTGTTLCASYPIQGLCLEELRLDLFSGRNRSSIPSRVLEETYLDGGSRLC